MTTCREKVRLALVKLCKNHRQRFAADYPFFTAYAVAEEAEVLDTTARRYLNDLCRYRGYERRKSGAGRGIMVGYRIDPFSELGDKIYG